ncbi:MAG: ribonuclease HII [Desulforhopalus sp.]|jgi:ribonuclease HII|nr:ribonuclease HII [Desulforhopalus sp.]
MQGLFSEMAAGIDDGAFEKALEVHGKRVAGCDEAGRGPLAGPVVAACVILPVNDHRVSCFVDSKTLSPPRREQLYRQLLDLRATIGIGIVSAATIDRINILQASLLAMLRAVKALPGPPPDFLLIDGTFTIACDIDQRAMVKGERKSRAIAAASIVAKVERDRLMTELHHTYPLYNFAAHKGYPTAAHRQALRTHGPCPAHRLTFNGVREHAR